MALSMCKKRSPLSFGAVTQWKRKNIHSIKRSWRAPLQSNRQQHAYICLPHPATYCNHLQSLLSLHPPTPCTWSPRQKPLCWVALSIPCKICQVNLCSGVLTLLAQELHCDMKRRLGTAKTYLETGEQTLVKCFGPTTCQAKNSCFHVRNVCLEESLVRQKLKPGSVEYLSGLWYVMDGSTTWSSKSCHVMPEKSLPSLPSLQEEIADIADRTRAPQGFCWKYVSGQNHRAGTSIDNLAKLTYF